MEIKTEENQENHRERLCSMYAQSYHIFKKAEFLSALRAYFEFLEKEISWTHKSSYSNQEFSTKQLESMIPELEQLLANMNNQKAIVFCKLQ